MMAVSADALTASASRGEATVTRPAPTLSAPRAASLAAPVLLHLAANCGAAVAAWSAAHPDRA